MSQAKVIPLKKSQNFKQNSASSHNELKKKKRKLNISTSLETEDTINKNIIDLVDSN